MNSSDPPSAGERRDLLPRLTVLLFRISGLMLFALGVGYWVRLVGVHDAPGWRFDLMSRPWQIVMPALAVLCPVAGAGLWLLASWGTVTWILVIAVESTMHLLFVPLFGGPTLELALNVSGLGLLGCLRLAEWYGNRLRHKRTTR